MNTSCPICVKTVLDSEDGVNCDGPCQRWFHKTCLNMSKTEYQRISSNTNVKWYCSRTDCVDNSGQPLNILTSQMTSVLNKLDDLLGKVGKIDEISRDVTDIKTEMCTIKAGLSALEPRVTMVEDRVASVVETVKVIKSEVGSSNIEAAIAEMNERTRRSKNVMVFNLTESSDRDANNRKRHDLDLINKLFSPLLPTLMINKTKAFRVGKKSPGKFRPLKVVLENASDVSTVISSFSTESAAMVDPSFSSVKVSRDKTPREISHLSSLRSELEERSAGGEIDLTIKYINNVPQIVKNQKNVQGSTVHH